MTMEKSEKLRHLWNLMGCQVKVDHLFLHVNGVGRHHSSPQTSSFGISHIFVTGVSKVG